MDGGTDELSDFLMERKKSGLAASSLRISNVHLKVFFHWLASRGKLPMDPAEPLLSPPPPFDIKTSDQTTGLPQPPFPPPPVRPNGCFRGLPPKANS